MCFRIFCYAIDVAIAAVLISFFFLGYMEQDHHILVVTKGKGWDLSPDFRGRHSPSSLPPLYIRSNNSHLWLFRREFNPSEESKALLLFSHGYAEHSAMFVPLAEHLSSHYPFNVVLPDLEGHGRSEGDRIFVPKFTRYAKDYVDMAKKMRKDHPGLPLFCGGHSMGALITALVAETEPEVCDAFIFSGLPVAGTFEDIVRDRPLLLALIDKASDFIPKMPLTIPTHPQDLSTDPAQNARWVADPLNHKGPILFRTGIEFTKTKEYVSSHASRINKPVIFLHGKEDRIAFISGAQKVYNEVSSTDKKFITYETRHCMNMEPIAEKFYDDIGEFITKHLDIAKN